MSRFPNLSNAPITEALIDVRVELPEETTIETLESIGPRISKLYPEVRKRKKWEGKLHFAEGGSKIDQTEEIDGLIYNTGDKKNFLQTQLDGFTFSRLKPYESWEMLYSEALRLWKLFSEVSQPTVITRIATRFINRLELPADLRDFSDYLTAEPRIPPRMPQNLLGFLSRIVIPELEFGGVAVITQALEGSTETGELPILLDIDVFKEGRFNADGQEAWEILNAFREVKNSIFFESITKELEGRYK